VIRIDQGSPESAKFYCFEKKNSGEIFENDLFLNRNDFRNSTLLVRYSNLKEQYSKKGVGI